MTEEENGWEMHHMSRTRFVCLVCLLSIVALFYIFTCSKPRCNIFHTDLNMILSVCKGDQYYMILFLYC